MTLSFPIQLSVGIVCTGNCAKKGKIRLKNLSKCREVKCFSTRLYKEKPIRNLLLNRAWQRCLFILKMPTTDALVFAN